MVEIGAVARELGVAPGTLRTWERRYHLVIPHRGEHGERLYDADQIAILQRILAQIGRGLRARAAHEQAAVPRPVGTLRTRLEPTLDAGMLARRAIDALLGEAADTRFAFSLRLVASELVNNAVLYGSRRESIRLDLKLFRERAELRVENGGGRLTMKNLRTKREDGGRGLEIVDALATGWSIETSARGTKIAVELSVERPAPAPRRRRREPASQGRASA